MFRAILIERTDDGSRASVQAVDEDGLPEGDVTVGVEWSGINYKDALAISGRAPVVRRFPMIPGIDAAGVVLESEHPTIRIGDRVALTGWDHGELRWGGLAARLRARGDTLYALPDELSTRDAMTIGTAGFTAALSVRALLAQGVTPFAGEVLVTGASGGVGAFAVALLARLGFDVVAASGRPGEAHRLLELGARQLVARETLSAPGKALGKERWAAAIDTVGSHTLANVCATTRYGGSVAACGNAQGMEFPATVAPFILRAVRLIGVNSVYVAAPEREAAWRLLVETLPPGMLEATGTLVPLGGAIDAANRMLRGEISGRVVVDVGGGS